MAARASAGACGEDGQQNGAEREREVAALAFNHAGNVALRDVTHFVRHDAGELAFALCGDDGAGMDGNVAAGEREGVERVVLDGKEKEVVGARARMAHELVAETPEIIHDLRIGKISRIRPHLRHQLRAEAVFVLRRKPRIGGGA